MQNLVDAILQPVKDAVSPVPAEMYRADVITLPFVWLRAPSSSAGPYASLRAIKDGLVYIDLWTYSWTDMDTLEAKLAFLDGYSVIRFVGAHGISYRQASVTRMQEEGACHSTLILTASYFDARVIA